MSVRASGRKTSHPTAIATRGAQIIKRGLAKGGRNHLTARRAFRNQVHTDEPGTFHGFDTQLVMARIIRVSEYVEQEGHDRPIML